MLAWTKDSKAKHYKLRLAYNNPLEDRDLKALAKWDILQLPLPLDPGEIPPHHELDDFGMLVPLQRAVRDISDTSHGTVPEIEGQHCRPERINTDTALAKPSIPSRPRDHVTKTDDAEAGEAEQAIDPHAAVVAESLNVSEKLVGGEEVVQAREDL
ncbi:hypothetical protein G7046_g9614 [Stylonectria norvegica]|nr:hypothetical protein G7046_g9614 [Stylonectria norvegica]